MNLSKYQIFSSSSLKLIALITMVIDHIGYLLFPQITLFRIIGRLSFPLYAFLIGEGCIHTKNKAKYLLKVFLTFITYEVITTVIHKKISLCVLFGFALFIVFTIIMDWAKKNWHKRYLIPELFAILSCIIIFVLDPSYTVFTFILPLIVYLNKNNKSKMIIFFLFSLILMSVMYGGRQPYGIIAIIPIVLYNGKKGKINLKNFFYIIYPLHYLILGIIQYFIK